MKFPPGGENVIIRMSVKSSDVHVSVVNQSVDITEEAKIYIFQKYFQADASVAREKGGTGLGLSTSKTIIERLNRRIDVLFGPVGETTFNFNLTVLKGQPETVRKGCCE